MIFISGHREISQKRLLELYKHYIRKDDLTIGFYKEDFIAGFENQPQFRTNKLNSNIKLLEKLKSLKINRKFDFIEYSQVDEEKIIRDLKPSKAIFINGSRKIAFHRRSIAEVLKNLEVDFSLKSPFKSEEDAMIYSEKVSQSLNKFLDREFKIQNEKLKITIQNSKFSRHAKQMQINKIFLRMAEIVSYRSFDYTWQTGAVLVKDGEAVLFGYNRILPYEAWMFHNGATKEHNFSSMQDLSANDTLHAEMDIISQAIKNNIDLNNTTLYVTLMPCPNCARMIATTGISRIVCAGSHSGRYAEGLFKELDVKVDVLR